jgi:hypothetical protein
VWVLAVQYRRPQLLRKSLAAISPFSVFRASPPEAEMAWPAAASRSMENGAEAWGAAGARDGPMAGSQDRRFPRAGIKKRLLHQWGLTDTLSAKRRH